MGAAADQLFQPVVSYLSATVDNQKIRSVEPARPAVHLFALACQCHLSALIIYYQLFRQVPVAAHRFFFLGVSAVYLAISLEIPQLEMAPFLPHLFVQPFGHERLPELEQGKVPSL